MFGWNRFRTLTLVALVLVMAVLASACAATPAVTPEAATPTPEAVTPTPEAATPVATPEEPTPTPAEPAVTPTPAEAATPEVTPTPTEADVPAEGDLEGRWEGDITVADSQIGIVVTFFTVDGELAGSLDIPAQGLTGSPLEELTYEPPDIYFETFSGTRLATFDGQVQEDGTIAGTFTQAGFEGTFALERAEPVVEDVPYLQEEVVFFNEDIRLAGTLTLPETEGRHPAVILITGSGPQDRDENILGFRIFAIIADHMTRNGIAVLRYDDRGVGGSTGSVLEATSEDLAGDVVAAMEFLQERDDIDPQQIGVLGHSEGGAIAPMVANRTGETAFVILLAGPGLPGAELLGIQLERVLETQGATEEDIAEAREQQQRIFEALRTGEGWDELREQWAADLREQIEQLPEAQREALGNLDEYIELAIDEQVAGVNNPWFRFFVDYDPRPALEELEAPVLAVFGGLDTQVPAEPNVEAMEAAFEAGDHPDYTIEVFPQANHLFQEAETGGPQEYGVLPPEFVPGLLDLLSEWTLERVTVAE